MKIAKIVISVMLLTTMSSGALAYTNRGYASVERCRMDFKTPWAAFQFIPCWAGLL